MKTFCTLLFLISICAFTKLYAQFTIPKEDLIMGKSGVWLPMQGGNTDGRVDNPWIYFDSTHLIYHYETPRRQHTQFYLVKIEQGGDFCRDSCITIYCYDSAQSVYVKNKTNDDKSYPTMTIRVDYAGGQINILPDGRQKPEYYIDVHMQDNNVTGGFDNRGKKSSKTMIHALLAKNKNIEYEGNIVDDVPFAHAHINWAKLDIETKGYSVRGTKLQQDSLKLVERKRHFDSLYSVPESAKKRAADSLEELAADDYWVEFMEKGDVTKEPQASIMSLLANKNIGIYKYHFFKKKTDGKIYVVVGNTSQDPLFYSIDEKTKEVVSLRPNQLDTDLLPLVFRY